MSENRSVFTNTVVYGASSAITTLALFFMHLVAARYLGAEDFGRFSFAIAFVVLFVPLLDPGLYYLTVRDVARQKTQTQHYLAHVLTWKVLVSPLFLLLIWVIVQFLHDSETTLQAVYLMAVAQILHTWKDAFRPILLAHELFDLDAISLAIERLTLFAVIATSLVYGKGLLWICWMFVIIRFFDLVIIAIVTQYKVCRISLGFNFSVVKELVYAAFPIGAFYMTLSVYNYIDTVMLSVLKSDQQVGWYSAAYKIYEGPVLIPAIIGTVFMPRLSRLFVENTKEFISLLEQGVKYIVLASMAVALNGILFSGLIVKLSYGPVYENSVQVLEILMAGLIFLFTIYFLQTVMISIDKQKIILYISLLGLGVNILVNAFLIPLYGYVGAAIATVAVEGMVCLILCMAFHRLVLKLHWWKFLVKPILVGLGIFIGILWVRNILPLYLEVLVMNGLLLGFWYICHVFNREEIQMIKKWIFFRNVAKL